MTIEVTDKPNTEIGPGSVRFPEGGRRLCRVQLVDGLSCPACGFPLHAVHVHVDRGDVTLTCGGCRRDILTVRDIVIQRVREIAPDDDENNPLPW